MPNYDVEIDVNELNTSHAQVIDLVGTDKRVLDVGCWTGELGRALQARGCRVSGVELIEDAAAEAANVLDEVKVADLDDTPLSSLFSPGLFDVIVFADVLEHVRNPEAVLTDARTLLAAGGRVVISIPNVTHGSLRLALLQGRWETTDTGLLDATHIQFFNRSGLLKLLTAAGLEATQLRGTTADPLTVEVAIDAAGLPEGVVEWVREQPDALVYQFQLAASPVPDGRMPVHVQTLVHGADPDQVRLQDVHTTAAQEAYRDGLRMRDHVVGLQAEATSAQLRATRQKQRGDRLQAEVARLRKRVGQLERRGAVGFARRVKRRLSR